MFSLTHRGSKRPVRSQPSRGIDELVPRPLMTALNVQSDYRAFLFEKDASTTVKFAHHALRDHRRGTPRLAWPSLISWADVYRRARGQQQKSCKNQIGSDIFAKATLKFKSRLFGESDDVDKASTLLRLAPDGAVKDYR
jgi:hypothetical protein